MHARLALPAALTLIFTLTATAASAQDLGGEVVRNPDDTVTYTFHIDGPPRGKARLYMSLWLLDPPYYSPSLGNLYLDPFFWMPVSPFLNLPPSGQAQLDFTVPSSLTAGIPLTFQTINLDVAGTLRLSNNARALSQNRFQGACPLDHTFGYDALGHDLHLRGHAPVGAQVSLQVVDGTGVRARDDATVGGSGEFQLSTLAPGGLTRADEVRVLCDGVQVDSIDLHR